MKSNTKLFLFIWAMFHILIVSFNAFIYFCAGVSWDASINEMRMPFIVMILFEAFIAAFVKGILKITEKE